MPVAAGDLGQQRQHAVPDIPMPGNDIPGFSIKQTIALGIIHPFQSHRPDDVFKVCRVHLSVPGHNHCDIDIVFETRLVPGAYRRPHAPVFFVTDQNDSRVGFHSFPHLIGCGILTEIINDKNLIDPVRQVLKSLLYQLLLIVSGNHNGNHFVFIHFESLSLFNNFLYVFELFEIV